MAKLKHGIIYLKIDGVMHQASGEFTFNVGAPKSSPLFGSGHKVAGTKEEPQAPSIKGNVIIQSDTDIDVFVRTNGATIALEIGDITRVLTDSVYSAEGEVNTSEGMLQAEWFGSELKTI